MVGVVVTNETTTFHGAVYTKGVQWNPECWDMENISDTDNMTIKHYLDRSNTKGRGLSIVGKGNKCVGERLV